MSAVSTSTSIWQQTAPAATIHPYPPLAQDLAVDVAIVGGGITGLTAALLLKRAGLSVAVIEAHDLGGGVTGFTTAHISEVPDIGYQELIDRFGESDARLAAQSRRAAIAQIAKLVEEEQIDCQFQRVPGYLYGESSNELPEMELEAEAAKELGVQASLSLSVPLPFAAVGVLFPDQAQFDAVQYLQGLAKAVQGGRGSVFANTRVRSITGQSPCQVKTERGTVTAQQVILATHTPIHDLENSQDLYLLSTKLAPYRSYAIAVKLSSATPTGLFWDTAEPYHYTRNYVDPVAGEFLIVGGEDHKTGAAVNERESYVNLENYVRSRYSVESVEARWSAQWYEPVDGLPFIGRSALNDHIYIGTGYSGNGMTFGTVAALLISDLILDRQNPWADLYSPNRIKPFAAPQDYITQNLKVASHWVGDRFRSEVQDPIDVPRGEGRLVKVEGEQLAIFCDDDGVLHAVSPVCTHAGCIVHWNNAEKSWDCPCHGGRFDCSGAVLNGPPLQNLAPKQV